MKFYQKNKGSMTMFILIMSQWVISSDGDLFDWEDYLLNPILYP